MLWDKIRIAHSKKKIQDAPRSEVHREENPGTTREGGRDDKASDLLSQESCSLSVRMKNAIGSSRKVTGRT